MAPPMSWHRPTNSPLRRKGGPPLGLRNLGNSCYLNSVLQCLAFTPPLAQFCLSSLHSSLCKLSAVNRDKECPFCILERQIVRCLSLDSPADAPSKLQKSLPLFAEHFRWGRQEDAHEFLRYAIDACHNASLKLLNASKPDGAAATSTVMSEIFGGAVLSQVKCLSCKGESNKTDEIMDLSLDIYQSNSLKNALARFFQPELLDGSNKYSCDKCKKLSVARKQIFMLRPPNVLVVQLKRFEGSGKINRNIEFEEILVLTKFMYNTSQGSQLEYSLFGSIVHSGFSPDAGHYYAYIKDTFGRWYCCNDTCVSVSSTQEVLSEKVYILFYQSTKQKPRSSKIESPCNGLKPSHLNGPSKTDSLCKGLKPSESNGNGISSFQKSTELFKPPPVKLYETFSLKNNGSISLENGKISPSPQIKPIKLKNLELKKVIENGNGNLEVRNGASVDKCNGQMDDSKMAHRLQASPTANGNAPEGSASDLQEHCKSKNLLVSNGIEHHKLLKEVDEDVTNQVPTIVKEEPGNEPSSNMLINGIGCSNLLKDKVDDDSDSEVVAALNTEFDCDNSSTHMTNKYYSMSASKRKLCDAGRSELQGLYSKDSSCLSTDDVSYTRSTKPIKHFPEELEKLKELLARQAYSQLQSCGWADRLHDFMRTRKRFCIQETDSCLDNVALRKQLISDAKKTFTCQIPEPLKSVLIEQLRSLYQGKYTSDA